MTIDYGTEGKVLVIQMEDDYVENMLDLYSFRDQKQ
jgi:hypothetical protein